MNQGTSAVKFFDPDSVQVGVRDKNDVAVFARSVSKHPYGSEHVQSTTYGPSAYCQSSSTVRGAGEIAVRRGPSGVSAAAAPARIPAARMGRRIG